MKINSHILTEKLSGHNKAFKMTIYVHTNHTLCKSGMKYTQLVDSNGLNHRKLLVWSINWCFSMVGAVKDQPAHLTCQT